MLTNRLRHETSPYLLQHAHNPIAWQPWDDEALALARELDRPIFLSVGYSACHWCHVMERESFEDAEIAAFVNARFVPIKVDREERPDVDALYMDAVQLMTGAGGWPMSVWLTPELVPFYAGTYFPPESRWGRPGFLTIMRELDGAWQARRDEIQRVGEEMTARLEQLGRPGGQEVALGVGALTQALGALERSFDPRHGGFGEAPKFPTSTQLDLLWHVVGDPRRDEAQRQRARQMAEVTLCRMASGGMWDHLGGGFHRYSVDAQWLIPHFEKMLYDNALLAASYLEAWQATGEGFYRGVVEGIVAYALRELRDEAGGFFSAQDADSEGVEGKCFVWTPAQIIDVLGAEAGAQAAAWWGVTDSGSFEHGLSALHRLHALDAQGHDAAKAPEPDDVARWRAALLAARRLRVQPATDDKVLAAWNGMMISALARAGAAMERPEWVEEAARTMRFVLDHMVVGDLDKNPTLMRTYKSGHGARQPGFLEDYAQITLAALDLFEATGAMMWREVAARLGDRMIALFHDDAGTGGLLFTTCAQHAHQLVRRKDSHDNATPSGNSAAMAALARLALLHDREDLRDRVARGLAEASRALSRHGHALSVMAQVLDAQVRGSLEVVIVHPDGAAPVELLRAVRQRHLPSAILITSPASEVTARAAHLPVLVGRGLIDGAAAVYVCEEGRCQRPVTTPGELTALLARLAAR